LAEKKNSREKLTHAKKSAELQFKETRKKSQLLKREGESEITKGTTNKVEKMEAKRLSERVGDDLNQQCLESITREDDARRITERKRRTSWLLVIKKWRRRTTGGSNKHELRKKGQERTERGGRSLTVTGRGGDE